MEFVGYLLIAALSGVLGGMGMGGGTVLIPLITMFFGVGQHEAQAANLIAFIPMAIVSLIIHFKNKLVQTKGIIYMILPAVICSFLSGLAAQAIGGEVLKRIFGAFLILLSFLQFFSDRLNGNND